MNLPDAWVPKSQSAWKNRLSIRFIEILMKFGIFYRRVYGIEDKHISALNKIPYIHELPFGLVIKLTHRATQESLATMTAHAMGLPVPRILCYADRGYRKFGYILMTRIPGERLWDVHESYNDKELVNIISDIGDCLQRIRRFSSPYGTAICGPDGPGGKEIEAALVPRQRWEGNESPEAYHDTILNIAKPETSAYNEIYAFACKLKEKAYRVVLAHGDLHPSNIMVKDGRLTGIIDWNTAAWLPEYWDFVNPMSNWREPSLAWAVELLNKLPGGEQYDDERSCYECLIFLAGDTFY